MKTRKVLIYLIPLLMTASPARASRRDTKSMTLRECLETARENNRSLLAAREKIEEAKKGLLETAGNFLPTVSLGGTYTRLDEEPRPLPEPLMPPDAYTSSDRYNITGTVRVPLFTGFRNRAAYRSASKALKIAEENYRKQKNELEFEITRAFYGAILAEKLVELNRESQKRLEKLMEQTRTLYENGLASRLDLLRSEVQYSNMKPQIIEAENNLRMAQSSLSLLIGRENLLILPEGGLEVEKIDPELGETLRIALERRPEINLILLQKSVAGESITLARSAAYPQINASYNRSFEHPDGMRDEWGDRWNIMLNVSLPLFRGFSTYSDTEKARSRLRQLEHNLEQLKESIRLEVENAYYELVKSEETIAALEKNVVQAGEAYSVASRRYSSGLLSSLEFMDTELDYMQARIGLIRAQADYITAAGRLRMSAGGEINK